MSNYKCEHFQTPFVKGSEAVVARYLDKMLKDGWEFVWRTPAGFTVFKKVKT